MKNILKIFVSSLFVFGSLFFANNVFAETEFTVTVTATPVSIKIGESSLIRWDSPLADSCGSAKQSSLQELGFLSKFPIVQKIYNFFSVEKASAAGVSGQKEVSPSVTSTYTITCSRAGYADVSGSATVTVTSVPPPLPDLTISASKGVLSGNTVTFSPKVTNQGNLSTLSPFFNAMQFDNNDGVGSNLITTTKEMKEIFALGSSNASFSTSITEGEWYRYRVRFCTDSGDHDGQITYAPGASDGYQYPLGYSFAPPAGHIVESDEGNNCSDWSCSMSYNEIISNKGFAFGDCSGWGGASSNIGVTLQANPTSVTLPADSTTLTWTTTGNPTSCVATGDWEGEKVGGTEIISNLVPGTHTFDITCSKAGETDATSRATVVVHPSESSAITVSLLANPSSMTLPTNSTTLVWKTTGNPTSCIATGSWSGLKTEATAGDKEDILNLTPGTHTFDITCTKAGLEDATASINVEVKDLAPSISVSLSASPSSLTLPSNSTTLTWETTGGPTSCEASNWWSNSKSPTGGSEERTGMDAGTYVFDITCHKDGLADATSRATVVVNLPTTPTGTLTATDCTIPENKSSCNTDLEWHTFNSISGFNSAVTTPAYVTVATGNDGTKSYPLIFPMVPGTRVFYLYHNEKELAQAPATATCSQSPVVTYWNGTHCTSSPAPVGTLGGVGCKIGEGQRTCPTTLRIIINNSVADALTNVTKNIPTKNTVVVPAEVMTTFPVDKAGIPVEYGGTTFYLNHNSVTLDDLLVGATCSQSPVATEWSFSEQKCVKVDTPVVGLCNNTHFNCDIGTSPVSSQTGGVSGPWTWICQGLNEGRNDSCNEGGGGTSSLNLTATPSKIFKGSSSKLTWNSEGMVEGSCVGSTNNAEPPFNTGGATGNAIGVPVTPKTTTIYKISCTKSSTNETVEDTAPITVNGIKIWET